jgi:hypothetical protein
MGLYNMKHLIKYNFENDKSVWIEVDEPENGYSKQDAENDIKLAGWINKDTRIFEEALDEINPAMQIILNKLLNLSNNPKELAIEFGIKMTSNVGAIIASTGMEANFKVTLIYGK